jgi:hypothetical protein
MLSSCADYTTSSQNSQTNPDHISLFPSSLDFYSSPNTTNRNVFTHDDSFSISFNSQNDVKQENEQLLIELTQSEQNQEIVISPKTISNTSSPSKHRVLNTPERLDQVKYSLSFLNEPNSLFFKATSNSSNGTRLVEVSFEI